MRPTLGTVPWLLVAALSVAMTTAPPIARSAPRTPTRAPARPRPPSRPRPPAPPRDNPQRAFLQVPKWYVDYEVVIKMRGPFSRCESHTTGRITLDQTGLGAVHLVAMPKVPNVRPPTKEEMLRAMSGQVTRSQEEIAQMLQPAQAMLDQYEQGRHWRMTPPDSDGSMSEAQLMDWLETNGPERTINYSLDSPEAHEVASGTGRMITASHAVFHFEVDVAKKQYAIVIPYRYYDTKKTLGGVRGTRRFLTSLKPPVWNQEPIARDFSSWDQSFKTVNPPAQDVGDSFLLRGKLPATVSEIVGSPSFDFTVYGPGGTGTLQFLYKVSPTPPQQNELVFDLDAAYEHWRPEAGRNETSPGPRPLTVRAHLQKKGGGPPTSKAEKFMFNLLNTSNEPGVCLNWPIPPMRDSPYDLQIPIDLNPNLQVEDPPYFQHAVQTGTGMTNTAITLASYDWGAHAALEIVAVLKDQERVTATVPNTPANSLDIPHCRPGSHIAQVWSYASEHRVGDAPDVADDEREPEGDGFPGDGLTQYEEYRGFMVGGRRDEGDPLKKDIFVLNMYRSSGPVARGVDLYEDLTGLVAHDRLTDWEVPMDGVINLNHAREPHVVDQHVIHIREVSPSDSGKIITASATKIGTPGTSRHVNIPSNWPVFQDFLRAHEFGLPSLERCVAHEMLHSSNVYHHGNTDEFVIWKLDPSTNPPGVIETSRRGVMRVRVLHESGRPVDARLLDFGVIVLGHPLGEHSGDYDCVMKHSVATAYPSAREPDVRYLAIPDYQGESLCGGDDGTKYNAATHQPQSRFGDAAAGRGRCKHQVRINDLGVEPSR